MPKVSGVPSYRLHKPSGNAIVQYKGERFYLGRYGTPESKARYSKFLANLNSPNPEKFSAVALPAEETLTVTELCAAYLEYAARYYRNEEGSMNRVRRVLKILKERYGKLPVGDFGPLALQAVQDHLVLEKVSRRYINHLTAGIKRVFRWGVSQQIVPPYVFQALECVNGLRKGRSDARENPPVKPVDDATVEATLLLLPEHIADLVRLQRLTGARSGEIVLLRPCDRGGQQLV
jgi:integrase